ncbi:MAG: glycosyltransferase [Polyangiaceae bacterium]|nr:glycosyltransferase [Polyangiaceae bacterium]
MEAGFVVLLGLLAAAYLHAWADFWLAPRLPRTPDPARELPPLSVLVPARNEEHNIEACLDSLAAQDYPDLEVLVVDDASTDRTAELVRARAAEDARIRLVPAPPLPEGWRGKCWALGTGAELARGRYLAMIDADVTLGPSALARAVSLARTRSLDLLSLLPTLVNVTFWEKVIQPVMGFMIFLWQPLHRANAPGSRVTVANGQFLLVLAEGYRALGGHGAVRSEVVEDVALAALYKRHGKRLGLALALGDVRARMYRGLGDIWRGWGKTIHPYLQRQPLTLWAGILALTVLMLLPFVALALLGLGSLGGAAPSPTLVALAAAAVGFILLQTLLFRGALGLELAHAPLWPLGFAVLFALFVARSVGAARGRGVEWKGRR